MPAEDRYASKPLLDKLGVKPGARVGLLRFEDDEFVRQLSERGAEVSRGRRRRGLDFLFVSVESSKELATLGEVEPLITRAGAVWAVYPKGRKDLREVDVIGAGVGFGLVDNKIVRFSDTHSALRFVIPLARR